MMFPLAPNIFEPDGSMAKTAMESPARVFWLRVVTIPVAKSTFLITKYPSITYAYCDAVGYDAKQAADPFGLFSPPAHRVHAVAFPVLLNVPEAHV